VGWKDTVDLAPGEEARVVARFDGYRGKYVFHCHNLEHEDMMMANFEVV
jgi:spore coat protein A